MIDSAAESILLGDEAGQLFMCGEELVPDFSFIEHRRAFVTFGR